ncbi:hypothetical protein [Staphylococcus saprophyticus]|nr:hypothetical protein [Staphylococcus saprophyticus]
MLDATVGKNYGWRDFIVGGDEGGVGDYYGS